MSDLPDFPDVATAAALRMLPDKRVAANIERCLSQAFDEVREENRKARQELEHLQSERLELRKLKASVEQERADLQAAHQRVLTTCDELLTLPGKVSGEIKKLSTPSGVVADENVALKNELAAKEARLKELEDKESAQIAHPEGLMGELALTYNKLAIAFDGIPSLPKHDDGSIAYRIAIMIGPLFGSEPASRGRLLEVLETKQRDWHCINQVLRQGLPAGKVGHDRCAQHPSGCPIVRVINDGNRDLLEFRGR